MNDPALLLHGGVLLFIVLAGLVWRLLRARARPLVILYGSNVMRWRGDGPDLDTLREMLRAVSDRGHAHGVIFDANAGYMVSGRYRDDACSPRPWACLPTALRSSRKGMSPMRRSCGPPANRGPDHDR